MSISLQKGSACTNCRHRKIVRLNLTPKIASALMTVFTEIDSGVTHRQSLEDQISILEARLRDLENGAGFIGKADRPPLAHRSGAEVYLRPLTNSTLEGRRSNRAYLHRPFLKRLQLLAVPASSSGNEALPPIIHQMLMINFIRKTCSLGFFLHKEKFKQAVFRPGGAKEERPTFALLNASYLWGIHLSSSRNPPDQEATLVSRALQSSAHALSENHSRKVVECIQSEVLLATYLYRAGRTVEGRYHCTAAASLVLSNGMHKIRAPSESSGYLETYSNPSASPRDTVEEGEQINAFWGVYILDIFWNVVYGIPSSIPPDLRVDCPWPRLIEDYEQTPYDPEFRNIETIERFLFGYPDNSNSPKANFAKAAVLFERATTTALQLKNDPSSTQFQTKFNSLDNVIQGFVEGLPPMRLGSPPPVEYQLCMKSLAHAAAIQLHIPFAHQNQASRRRILKAAKAILEFIDDWSHIPEMEFIDPMLAIIWALCCKVFIEEGLRMKMRCAPALFSPVDIRAFSERIIVAMENHNFPLMRHQLAQVRDAFARTYLKR
ncbi:hypothetical protein D9757_002087 [Collybiopsis confluens]|uniref:Xylanolytic transcriptional activator regulatory domain-containing protein n=1 Tax=Collybiopsis confluens TaxID=2823264 RepID=A0A8H5HXN7_9AGAR|nr:hypothetical protein D9757_002087 [Collybiopsis confluens]